MARADTHIRLTATGDTLLKGIWSFTFSVGAGAGTLQLRQGAAGTVFFEIQAPATSSKEVQFGVPIVCQSGETWQAVITGVAPVFCANGYAG